MVNQLRYDISIKDNLLKTFLDSESDNSFLDDTYTKQTTVSSKAGCEATVNEYKNKIQDLEEENEQLKSKYEFLEREATDLDTKESVLIENCFRELDESNYNLQLTEQALEEKRNVCSSQQQEIQNLFSQIFELQLTVKNLTQENNDLQSGYSASVTELVDQVS
jgi:cell division protein FtsB